MLANLNRNIGLVLIMLHFLMDFFVKLLLYIGIDEDPGNSTIVYFKILIFIGLIMFAIINFKSNKKLLFNLLLICVTGFVGWLSYFHGIDSSELYIFIKTMVRYVYPFFWLIFFLKLSPKQIENSIIGFRLVLFINTILILIGLLFNIGLFSAYDGRFGYDGVFYLANDASPFYFLGLVVLYDRIRAIHKEWMNVFEFLFLVIGSLLLGTKTAYLFILIFTIYHIYSTKNYIQGLIMIVFLLAILIMSGVFTFFIDLAFTTDILTSVLSFRNELFLSRIIPLIENWGVVNYFFGGCNYIETYIQMDLIDVFVFFGIVGGSIYCIIFFKEFFYVKANSYLIYIGIVYVILGALAGHFYPSGVVAIYLALVCISQRKKNNFESSTHTRLAH
ncbi:hypothetical protein [Plebeiibacterium sediminum]|uniref:Uncharacterized protein n=1 Tax=Plebeiibacterium sediminum TaxID=2992112 RepID=A0AAE3M4J4_9BACT|nr:hypothetical protein [Plebeiobacterium sediminum]MCW3786759.1 hypothetical protein [Plebeiobacterium sediminum]